MTILSIALGVTIGVITAGLAITFVMTRKPVVRWLVDKSMSITQELINAE